MLRVFIFFESLLHFHSQLKKVGHTLFLFFSVVFSLTSFQAEAGVSIENAHRIFKILKEDRDLKYSLPESGCEVRSMLSQCILQKHRIESSLIRAQNIHQLPNRINLLFPGRRTTTELWNYHQAIAINVKISTQSSEQPINLKYIIDPLLFDRLATLEDWMENLGVTASDIEIHSASDLDWDPADVKYFERTYREALATSSQEGRRRDRLYQNIIMSFPFASETQKQDIYENILSIDHDLVCVFTFASCPDSYSTLSTCYQKSSSKPIWSRLSNIRLETDPSNLATAITRRNNRHSRKVSFYCYA